MSFKLRAGSSMAYVLDGYRDDPDAIKYQIRVLSADANDQLIDLRDEYLAAKNDKAEQRRLRLEMLKIAVVDSDGLTATLTDRECWELIAAAIKAASLTVDERKKFELQCSSEMASSANDVEPSA